MLPALSIPTNGTSWIMSQKIPEEQMTQMAIEQTSHTSVFIQMLRSLVRAQQPAAQMATNTMRTWSIAQVVGLQCTDLPVLLLTNSSILWVVTCPSQRLISQRNCLKYCDFSFSAKIAILGFETIMLGTLFRSNMLNKNLLSSLNYNYTKYTELFVPVQSALGYRHPWFTYSSAMYRKSFLSQLPSPEERCVKQRTKSQGRGKVSMYSLICEAVREMTLFLDLRLISLRAWLLILPRCSAEVAVNKKAINICISN